LDQPHLANKQTDISGAPLQDRSNHGVLENFPNEKVHASHAGTSTPSENGLGQIDGEEHDGYDEERPTEEEKKTLRHIGEPLPKAAFLVAIVELCERFTYYGASGIFQNYVQRPLDGSLGRGALGMGHQGATGLTTFFQFWCYGTFWSRTHAPNEY
jgi:POT family proton-dependent oligopeptide transporter